MTAQAPATAAGYEYVYGSQADGIRRFGSGYTSRDYVLAIEAQSAAAERAAIRAGVQLRLLAGATDARYSPTEVAELVSAVVDARP